MIKIEKILNIRNLIITLSFTCLLLLFTLPISASEPINNEFIVGKDNKISVSLKGLSGYTGGLGAEVEEVEFNYYFPQKIEGKFFAEETDSLTKDLMNIGKTDITIYSDSAGQVDVVFAFKITYKNNAKPIRLLTEKFTFNFIPETEKKTLAYMFIGSPDSPSQFSAQIIDNKVYLPLDITMQIIGTETVPVEQFSIVKIDEVDFITVGDGFHAIPLDNGSEIKIEKVLDKNGNISKLKIVQYIEI